MAERISESIILLRAARSQQRFAIINETMRIREKLNGENIIITMLIRRRNAVINLLKQIIKLYDLIMPNLRLRIALKNLPPSRGSAGIRLNSPIVRFNVRKKL